MKTYDTFTPNILEMQGRIERKPFSFVADNCKIWHQGSCIADWNSYFQIDAEINPIDEEIVVTLDNSELSNYITDYFTFSEISLNNDRVLWSNNLLSGCVGAEEYEPTNMSLFYYQGVLSRIYLNVETPAKVMLELTSNNAGQISDAENPLKKIAEQVLNACKTNNNIDLGNVHFVSNSHQRYENGLPVRGLQQCRRAVKIEENITGCEGYNIKSGEGYIVTVLNLDGNHPMWGNNVQMTPKPMKIVSQTDEQFVLRGYKCQAMSPFGWIDFNGTDYGLSVIFRCGEIDKCVLHMHDRNIDIEYFK
jgi:hypothetical protein